jgi:Mce-associated membrane protein
MSEPPRDPLAEHPLGSEVSQRPARGKTLSLFPDLGEAPLRATADEAPPPAPSPAPVAPGQPEKFPEAEEVPEDAEAGSVAFARRIVAGLADLLILALVGAVELAAGTLLLDLHFLPPASLPLAAFLLLVALVLLVLAPFVWGTTPGMALAELKILAGDGGSPTLAASFLRFLGFLLTGLLAGVPLLLVVFDRRGRTFADLLSGTTVVAAERRGV